MFALQLFIKNGKKQSDIAAIPSDRYVSSLFVPQSIKGAILNFFGSFDPNETDPENFNQLLFSIDLASTDPSYKGFIVPDLQSKFAGLASIYCETDEAQTEDMVLTGGCIR